MTAPLFALGLYVPASGTVSPYGPYDPTLPVLGQHPLGGDYGGPYVLEWFTNIPPPNAVQAVPAPPLGTSLAGAPVVRDYESMTWSYQRIKPDRFYWLYTLFRYVRRTAGPLAGKVVIQWPDPESGAVSTASARWDTITGADRVVSGIQNVQLVFSHLGYDDDPSNPPNGIYLPTIQL